MVLDLLQTQLKDQVQILLQDLHLQTQVQVLQTNQIQEIGLSLEVLVPTAEAQVLLPETLSLLAEEAVLAADLAVRLLGAALLEALEIVEEAEVEDNKYYSFKKLKYESYSSFTRITQQCFNLWAE